MFKPGLVALFTVALLVGATGCGNYTITFEVEKVINTYDNKPNTSQQLEIDIVCLTGDEAKRVPDLARGAIGTAEWFAARSGSTQNVALRGLQSDRVYSLSDKSSDLGGRSTRIGEPLLSADRYADGSPRRTFKFKFPEFLQGDAVILVYARFFDAKGIRDMVPIRLSPPPRSDSFTIRVGQEGIVKVEN